jgi:hypothetical protein
LHAYVRAALGEPDAVPGAVSLAQSFGSLAHWHPHLHLVVTDGGFRHDGGFVSQVAPDATVLAEAWRRAVLAFFVREGWLEEDAAAVMLAWPHSGFNAYVGPAITAADQDHGCVPGDPRVERDPARVAAHHLDHHQPPVRGRGGVRPVEALGRERDRGEEQEL